MYASCLKGMGDQQSMKYMFKLRMLTSYSADQQLKLEEAIEFETYNLKHCAWYHKGKKENGLYTICEYIIFFH